MTPETHSKLEIGDLVQINPDSDKMFGGSIMVITEPKTWGAQGYVQVLREDGGQAYYRCKTENMELVGRAEWMAK